MPLLLVHETQPSFLQKILEEGSILPAKAFDKRYTTARYNNVYLGVLFKFLSMFPSDVRSVSKTHFDDKAILFFSTDLLHSTVPECWSPTWRFGDCSKKDSIKYKKTLSPKENIQVWKEAYKAHVVKLMSLHASLGKINRSHYSLYMPKLQYGQNELVFSKPLPLTHLVAVFSTEDIVLPEHVHKLSTLEELSSFLSFAGYKPI